MKRSITLLSLLALTSCGGGDKNFTSDKETKTNAQNGVLVEGQLETSYSDRTIVKCALEDIENNDVMNPRNTQFKFDINIPERLTRNITADLQSKVNSPLEKITPSTFWSTLDSGLANELNEILIDLDINRNGDEFKKLQQEIAFAYTVFIENPTHRDGYRLVTKENDTIKSIKISFSQKTIGYRNISPCESYEIGSIKIPTKLKTPSDITARISCVNSKGDTLSIEGERGYYGQNTLNLNIRSSKIVETFKLVQNQIEIKSETAYNRYLNYKVNENYNYNYLYFKVKKKNRIDANSIDKIDLLVYPRNGIRLSIKGLNCMTLKKLTLN